MNEKILVQNLIDRDESSYKYIIDVYQKKVLNTCYRFVNDKSVAEDLTQDVFLEVFRSIEKFRGESKLSTWIYKIAVTKSLDQIKSSSWKNRFNMVLGYFNSSESEEQEFELPDLNVASPHKELENIEMRETLQKALNSLPENQRVAFTLCKYDDMSYNEIAEILNVSVSSVESLIHRAKAGLKKKLYNYYKKQL